MTEEESSALLNKLEDISQKYENEVGIVTVNSLEGKTAEAYADDYYDYNEMCIRDRYLPVATAIMLPKQCSKAFPKHWIRLFPMIHALQMYSLPREVLHKEDYTWQINY